MILIEEKFVILGMWLMVFYLYGNYLYFKFLIIILHEKRFEIEFTQKMLCQYESKLLKYVKQKVYHLNKCF